MSGELVKQTNHLTGEVKTGIRKIITASGLSLAALNVPIIFLIPEMPILGVLSAISAVGAVSIGAVTYRLRKKVLTLAQETQAQTATQQLTNQEKLDEVKKFNNQTEAKSYYTTLYEVIHTKGFLPDNARGAVIRVLAYNYALVTKMDALSVENQHTVEAVIKDYLPGALTDYSRLPNNQRQPSAEATDILIQQLETLASAVKEIHMSADASQLSALKVRSTFLSNKFMNGITIETSEIPVVDENPTVSLVKQSHSYTPEYWQGFVDTFVKEMPDPNPPAPPKLESVVKRKAVSKTTRTTKSATKKTTTKPTQRKHYTHDEVERYSGMIETYQEKFNRMKNSERNNKYYHNDYYRDAYGYKHYYDDHYDDIWDEDDFLDDIVDETDLRNVFQEAVLSTNETQGMISKLLHEQELMKKEIERQKKLAVQSDMDALRDKVLKYYEKG